MAKKTKEAEEEEERKSFKSVINKKNLGNFEMDMLFFEEGGAAFEEKEDEDLE